MRRIILLLIVIIIAVAIYFAYKSRGALPAVLPPSSISTTNEKVAKQTVNESKLTIPPKFSLRIFASKLGSPRDLEFTEGGTLLSSVPQTGKIMALPDKNQDGKADETKTILSGLSRPHGIAFYKGKLYVAEETKVSRYLWNENSLTATLDKKLFDLPKGGRHFTRTIAFDQNGRMFVSLGSTCDVCFENEEFRAAIIVSDAEGASPRIFAKGLRNAVFITVNPQTNQLWGTEMGRDFLGDNLPPDEINILEDGKNYGWPICYGNKIHDTNFDERQYVQDPCNNTQAPTYEIAAHSAPLGLQFVTSDKFPKDWQGDLLVAYHGSWNRSTPIGYKVVHIKLKNNKPVAEEDFISGFLEGSQAIARPVDLIFDKSGSLYISDDKAGFIFKADFQN